MDPLSQRFHSRALARLGWTEVPPGDREYRASGACVCEHCGQPYRDHPFDPLEISDLGEPYLHVLCNGDRVKL